MFAGLTLVLLLSGLAQAQDIPIRTIPNDLPQTVRDQLAIPRAKLDKRVDAHNAWVTDFASAKRCGDVPANETARATACGLEYQKIVAEETTLIAEKRQFAALVDAAIAKYPCASIEGQLARDNNALRVQQQTNEMGSKEIDEWARASEEAKKGAVLAGVNLLLHGAATHLARKETSVRAFQGWLTRYDKQLRARRVPIEALQGQIESAMRGYVGARVQAVGGAAIRQALDVNELWKNFQTQAGLISRAQAESDAALKAALNDPTLQLAVKTDATGRDLARSALDVALTSSDLVKFGHGYAVLSFAADYGYEASKWTASYNRIKQQRHLSDKELEAVASLKRQIERTVASLKACRAAKIAAVAAAVPIVGCG